MGTPHSPLHLRRRGSRDGVNRRTVLPMGIGWRLVINAAALWVATRLVPGISFNGDWWLLFGVALVFGVMNVIVRPILIVLTFPFLLITLGLFLLVLNAVMLLLTSAGDTLVDPRCSQRLARVWGLPIAEHPSAGHDLPLDDGPWLAGQIARWVGPSHR